MAKKQQQDTLGTLGELAALQEEGPTPEEAARVTAMLDKVAPSTPMTASTPSIPSTPMTSSAPSIPSTPMTSSAPSTPTAPTAPKPPESAGLKLKTLELRAPGAPTAARKGFMTDLVASLKPALAAVFLGVFLVAVVATGLAAHAVVSWKGDALQPFLVSADVRPGTVKQVAYPSTWGIFRWMRAYPEVRTGLVTSVAVDGKPVAYAANGKWVAGTPPAAELPNLW